MKADYAKRKLTSLLADDLSCYTDGEFARQMMRIIDGATGYKVELMMEQNTLLAQRVQELQNGVLGLRVVELTNELDALKAQVERLSRTTFDVVCAAAILDVPINAEESHKCLAARDAEVARKAFVAGVEWLKDLPAYSVAGLDSAVREHIRRYSTTGTWLKGSNTHCNAKGGE